MKARALGWTLLAMGGLVAAMALVVRRGAIAGLLVVLAVAAALFGVSILAALFGKKKHG